MGGALLCAGHPAFVLHTGATQCPTCCGCRRRRRSGARSAHRAEVAAARPAGSPRPGPSARVFLRGRPPWHALVTRRAWPRAPRAPVLRCARHSLAPHLLVGGLAAAPRPPPLPPLAHVGARPRPRLVSLSDRYVVIARLPYVLPRTAFAGWRRQCRQSRAPPPAPPPVVPTPARRTYIWHAHARMRSAVHAWSNAPNTLPLARGPPQHAAPLHPNPPITLNCTLAHAPTPASHLLWAAAPPPTAPAMHLSKKAPSALEASARACGRTVNGQSGWGTRALRPCGRRHRFGTLLAGFPRQTPRTHNTLKTSCSSNTWLRFLPSTFAPSSTPPPTTSRRAAAHTHIYTHRLQGWLSLLKARPTASSCAATTPCHATALPCTARCAAHPQPPPNHAPNHAGVPLPAAWPRARAGAYHRLVCACLLMRRRRGFPQLPASQSAPLWPRALPLPCDQI
ncbi:MAG: hypothetical protein J3K34DRAFT_443928 [Monoraphidium minutum]|nr:MAG: hypothetical protein J3K34DRAFT_443928 [Monoraphidium minutum]